MSFRQYGGMNYAAKNNVIKNNYSNVNNLSVMTKVGQPNTYINFESDISGNLRVSGDFDLSGNLYVSGDIDCSGNLIIHGDFDLNGDLIVDKSIYANEMYLTGPVVDVPNSVVPKSYVDAISSGIYPTLPCKCATTAPITLSGIQTIDGYTVSAGDRVLVNNQNGTNSSIANGIYDVSSGLWSRASDCSGNNVRGQATFVQFGNTNQRSTFIQTATGTSPAIAGVDALLYQKYNTINLSLGQGLQFVDSNTIQVKSDLSNNPFITGLAVGNAVGSGPYNAGIFYETNTKNQIFVMPLSGLSSYNPINQTGDSGIVGRNLNGKDQQTLTMSIWSDTTNGLRISPQSLVLGYGGTTSNTPISRITFDSSNCFIDSSKCTIDSSNCVINGPLNATNGNVSLATAAGNVYIGNQSTTNIYSWDLQCDQYDSRLGLAILAEKYPNSQANYLTLAPHNNNYSFIQSWRYDASNNPVYPLLLNPNGGTVAINKVVSGTTFTYALDVSGSAYVSNGLTVNNGLIISSGDFTVNNLIVNNSVSLNGSTTITQQYNNQNNELSKTTIRTSNASPTNANTLRILDDINNKGIIFNPYASATNYNPTTQQGDALITGGTSSNNQSLNISVYGSTATGVRITPTDTTITEAVIKYKDGFTGFTSRPWVSMGAVEEISYFTSRSSTSPNTFCKSCTFDITTCTPSTITSAQNTIQYGLVLLREGESYNGIFFWSGNSTTFRGALYETGVSPPKLAERTTNYTSVSSQFNFMTFDTTYTSPTTRYAYVALVPNGGTHSQYVFNWGNTNYGRTASANNLQLIAFNQTGFSGSFPNPYSGTPIVSSNKYFLGIY